MHIYAYLLHVWAYCCINAYSSSESASSRHWPLAALCLSCYILEFAQRTIPLALWAALGGAAQCNHHAQAINNKTFQSSYTCIFPQQRRSTVLVELVDLFKFYASLRSLISSHLLQQRLVWKRMAMLSRLEATGKSPRQQEGYSGRRCYSWSRRDSQCWMAKTKQRVGSSVAAGNWALAAMSREGHSVCHESKKLDQPDSTAGVCWLENL